MHGRARMWIVGALLLSLAACGDEERGDEGAPESAGAAPLSTPEGSIEHQLALLRAQDVERLRACFTRRLQERITAEIVAAAQRDVAGATMADLWASAAEGEHEGRKTMKVKMKNGRTLTTLVLTDGRWLADTIWFR